MTGGENTVLADDDVSSQVDAVLDKKSQPDDLEKEQLVNKLVDSQYTDRLGKLKKHGLYNPEIETGDVPPPDSEQVKNILRMQLTVDQMAVVKDMEKPVLQLIPITSMDRYIKAMDSHKPIAGQRNLQVLVNTNPFAKALKDADTRDNIRDGDDRIIGWRIAVTEGAKKTKPLEHTNPEYTKYYKSLVEKDRLLKEIYGNQRVFGVDFKMALLLTADSLEDNDPMDFYDNEHGKKDMTIINEEGLKNMNGSNDFYEIHWDVYYNAIVIATSWADCVDDNIDNNFRKSVVFDVPNL